MSWFNNNWKYRKKITINSSLISTSLTDFTFLLKMSNGHLAENARSDASDIIFVDINGIQLSHEIIRFNKSVGNLVANVKLNVSNTVNTEFYMYYGNTLAINSQNKNEANKNFAFVSHLAFDPMITPVPLDKGPYPTLDRLGTWDIETNQKISYEDSPVGFGLNFNQLNSQYFRSEKLDFTGAQTFSIEAWIKRTTIEDDRIIAQGYTTDPILQDFNLGIQNSKILSKFRTDLTASSSRAGNTDITLNEWHHVAYIWKANANSLKIILNGNDDGAFIVNGNTIDCFYQRTYPDIVKAFIGTADDVNNRLFDGGMAGVKISTDNNYTENHIKLNYINATNPNFYTIDIPEAVPGLLLGENQWRSDYIDYLKRLKVFIKKEEIIGTSDHSRFPFLLNLYTPCLNEASPYGHDIVITDNNGERLPFERMLFRQNINQQRYTAAYLVDFVGTAQQIYDVNAEGTYRASYLSGIGNFIRFNEVQILNQGIHNLVIRYSNGSGITQNVDVRVNGVTYLVDMPSTGSWSTFSTVSIPINWTQQWNIIEIGANSTAPDIDWIQPLGQETAQLKGFILLPELSKIEDTEIDIYFKNPLAPIRLNPAHGQPETTIQAETMTLVSNYQLETNTMYSSGQGLRLTSTAAVGVATTIFTGVSGFYDVVLEVMAENDGLSGYSIRINGALQKIFQTKQVSTDNTRIHFLKRNIRINNGDTVEIRSNSSTTSCFGRFGFVRYSPTLLDPNTQWNSEEVWQDYEAVWHLDGTPGVASPFFDYSGKERHLFSYGMTAGVNKINSAIGVGVNFFDDNDKLYGHFDPLNLSQGDFTLSSWVQRSPALDNNRGIFVTDNLNWRFERFERMRIEFGGSNFQYFSQDFNVSDRFIYHSTTFNSSNRLREGRVNGNNVGTNTYTNNASGLNNSIAIGYPRNEHNIYSNESETFRGIIAEVRIRKSILSQDFQRNEHKNAMFPQQYINYDTTYCETNRRDYEIDIEANGRILTYTPSNQALYVLPRDMSGTINSFGDNLFMTLHIERDMIGSINVSSDDIERDFILIRDMTGGLLTQTDTTAGVNWTIEFVRFFTGGILSGDVDVNPEANFITNTEGSVSFGYINTSHVIDNGFTLEIVFHDAIGGTGITSGAIINNISRYVDNISGGFAWTGGTDKFDRESHYNEIENTGSIFISGSIVDLFEIHCLPETSFADVKVSGTSQNEIVNYIKEVVGFIYVSADIEYYHQLHVLPIADHADAKISGNNQNTHEIIYNEIENAGSVFISGSIQSNTEANFIQEADYVDVKISGNNQNTHEIIYIPITIAQINILGSSLNEIITFIPEPNGIINCSGIVNESDEVVFITNSDGSLSFGLIDTSYSVNLLQELHILYTENGGIVHLRSDAIRVVVYLNNETNGLINTTIASDRENNYFKEVTGSIFISGSSSNNVNYIDIESIGSFSVDVVSEVVNDYNYIENIGGVLTTSLEDSEVIFIKEVKVNISIIGSTIPEFYPLEDSEGIIIISGISQQLNVNNYNPLVGGSLYTSGDVVETSSFIYEVIDPILTLVGNAIDDFLIDCYFDNTLEIVTNGNAWISQSIHNIYIEEFTGGITIRSGALVVIYDSTLIPYDKCVKGRVATTGQLPNMFVSSFGDIYYVENNNTSNWWEFKDLDPTDNFIPIANPFFNTGVLGVYNSIADLPTTGNSIGDVWQIGKCHDGVYYVYTENGWEEDTLYPPQIHIERISIGVLKTSGIADKEVNYETTEIEVNGTLLTTIISIPYSTYNSTLVDGSLYTSGSYDDFLVSGNNIGNGLITLIGEITLPIIDRDNEQIVYAYIDGSADKEVSYEQETPTIFLTLLGDGEKFADHYPDTSLDRLIQISGTTPQSDYVNRIYIPTGTILLSGNLEIDFIDYNIISITGSLLQTSSQCDSYVIYDEFNTFAIAYMNGNSEILLSSEPETIIYAQLSGSNEIEEASFEKEVSGEFILTLDSEIESHYYPEVSGQLTWKKDVSANLVIIGETLIAYFTPYGGVKFFGFYLNVNCNYHDDSLAGIISLSGEELPKVDFNNPDYDSGSISLSGEIEEIEVDYNVETLLQLSFINNTFEEVGFVVIPETIKLEIIDFTENSVVYTPNIFGVISISSDDIYTITNFVIGDIKRKITSSGTALVRVFRNNVGNTVTLITNGETSKIVRFNAAVDDIRVIRVSGTSAPNNYITINRPLGRRIQTSGACDKIVSFNVNIINPRVIASGSAFINVIYPHIITGKINTSGTGPYRFVLYRDFIGGINLSGGVDNFSTFLEYRYRVSGGINLSGEPYYTQSHNWRILGLGGRINSSGSADYIHERNHVYNVSGGMSLSGGTNDPTEFYLTIAGQLNVYGTASVRARYIHNVETEVIKLTIDGFTEASELHNFRFIPIIEEIILSGEIEEDVIKNYIGEVVEEIIILSGDFEYYDILDYIYEPFGIIQLLGSSEQYRIYNHIAETEIPQIILSGDFEYYQDFNKHEVSGGIITSGIDITIEEFECIYKPTSGGMVWSKGTIVDPTNYNEYIKEDFDGSIKLKGLVVKSLSRIFYYEATHSHLGSIVISGWAITKPELKSIIEVNKIIVWNPEDITYQIGYTQRLRRPTIRILTSGSIESNINFFFNGNGIIKLSGKSLLKVNYKSTLSPSNNIITSGTELPRINIEREMEGSILINGIAGGNVNILPEVQGWIIMSGGIETADYVNYGQVDHEIVYLKVITKTLYRDHGELLLQFNEITKRREYESGIGDDETSTPEDTWSILQNFNDLLEEQ